MMLPEGTQTCATCGMRCDPSVTETMNGKIVRVVCRDCDKAARFKVYAKTKYIDSWTMIDACCIAERFRSVGTERDPELVRLACEVADSVARIEKVVKKFEREVWYAHGNTTQRSLQSIVRAASTCGMSAVSKISVGKEDAKFLVFCSAGRCVMTIDTPTSAVTVITAEDEAPNSKHRGPKPPGEGPMGIQGIHATEQQAVALLEAVIAAWKRDEVKLAEDTKVGF
ncbi:hypothetical protein Rctr197k_225 [Virus Rctr197k]|nr:hypothetical protein Rctr197k_225 [Virus Rctr197k]